MVMKQRLTQLLRNRNNIYCRNGLYYILLFFLAQILSNCQNDKMYEYYENTDILFAEREKKENSDTMIINHYYSNGNIKEKTNTIPPSFDLEGTIESFYKDGFQKEKCELKKGIAIPPKQTGKHNGYKIKIDFGSYETMSNGQRVRPFRTFVDGVSTDEYIVAIADTGGYDFLPQRMPKDMKRYKIVYGDGLRDTNEVEIDESLYTYYIEDLNRAKMVNSNGDTCILVYFYYKSVFNHPYPNDERMVVMHDSLNWKVTKFNKHYE